MNRRRGRERATLLFSAISEDHRDTAEVLVGCGADVNATTSGGLTALMAAASKGLADGVCLFVLK